MNNVNNFDKALPPTTITPENPVNQARRNQVLYVRVTPAEKETIVERAIQARLSVSRYLTRFALDGKAPLPGEEKKRLENLIILFKRTETGLRYLWEEANTYQLFSRMPGVEEDFSLAAQTLSSLIRELTKRL
jgi:hypothetical protein